jgi:hypothetical protein
VALWEELFERETVGAVIVGDDEWNGDVDSILAIAGGEPDLAASLWLDRLGID